MKPYLAAIAALILTGCMIGGGCTPPDELCLPPTFTPDGCTFADSVAVQISCSSPGATIRYTTDGTTPSPSNGTVIASGDSVTLTSTTTLAAIAYGGAMIDSPVKQAVYTKIDPAVDVAQPTFNPDGISFTDSLNVQIACSTPGATICYTTDGSTPSPTNGTAIASGGSVTISDTTTLAAMAYASGMTDSPVKQALYLKLEPQATVAQPTFSPDGGSFVNAVNVQISCSTSGATIRYTTDGSTPSADNGTIIASGGSVTLSGTTTLAAIACANGMIDSPVKQATYTKQTEPLTEVAQPTFNPDSGTFAGSVIVQLSCSTPGATIRYTTDGSTPSESHGTPVDIGSSITLNSTTSLAAVAYKNGMLQSTVKQATYTRMGEVAQPVFNPNGGTFNGSVDVQVSCSTSGATIRYTTDGSTPSSSHGTIIVSGSSLHFDSTTTLKAMAYRSGWVDSGIAAATFTVYPLGMVLIPAGEFQMGDPFTIEGDTDERPRHAVYVDAVYMDRYEVTNQQYAAALNWALGQGGLITVTSGVVYQYGTGTNYPYCDTSTSSSYSQITWNGSAFGVVSGKESYPVVMVSWYGAVAYANWRSAMQGKPFCYDLSTWECNWGSGYRLPTEAEWERAARGGVEGHRFPWSSTDMIDHSRANYYSSTSYFYDLGEPYGFDPVYGNAPSMPYTSPVGHFAANAYGLYDMAGNVWEWCHDWSDGGYYAVSPYNNPRGPASGSTRSLRGGSWGSTAVNQRCAFRSDGLPGYRSILNGFRLVMDVP